MTEKAPHFGLRVQGCFIVTATILHIFVLQRRQRLVKVNGQRREGATAREVQTPFVRFALQQGIISTAMSDVFAKRPLLLS